MSSSHLAIGGGIVSEEEEEEEIMRFVDSARRTLAEEFRPEGADDSETESFGPSWGWVFFRILKTCVAYSSGVTPGILLSDLFLAWNEQNKGRDLTKALEFKIDKKKQNRARLPRTITIDTIYEKNFLSLESTLEVVVVEAFLLPGTNIHMLRLGDAWSSNTIELYLHHKFYDLVDPMNSLLKKGREIYLTGCHLRNTRQGSGHLRLLPTEYLVIILDEDQDEDALILGAQFCNDSFCSLSYDAAMHGTMYSLYARIEAIGPLESHGKFGGLKRRQITLVDNEGYELKFLLWGEQIVLADLFSVGSMLALDRPFVANALESNVETTAEICLEYGSATHLYLFPFLQHEEQVVVPTQNRFKEASVSDTLFDHSQEFKVTQVTLPCDFQGSIDFSSYPSRLFVADLGDKMNHVCLYGVVKSIRREIDNPSITFSMTIEDATGRVVVKLHFLRSWSLGKLSHGHTIFISGLTCSMSPKKSLEVLWFEKDTGTSLVNISCLPALLNSTCLHKLSRLSELQYQGSATHICSIWVEQIETHHVKSKLLHSLCGQYVCSTPSGPSQCSFCLCACEGETLHAFHVSGILADDSGKIFAQCSGRTATELLQISPDEFFGLPEDEQIMYLYSLQNEKFMVAIVEHGRPSFDRLEDNLGPEDDVRWEIVRALKCD
ncbi:uncharacterized protein LOC116254782 [Nymphaea colorata]|nr:uncharacterized protein LOC116254782 [Nymphaea colorata]